MLLLHINHLLTALDSLIGKQTNSETMPCWVPPRNERKTSKVINFKSASFLGSQLHSHQSLQLCQSIVGTYLRRSANNTKLYISQGVVILSHQPCQRQQTHGRESVAQDAIYQVQKRCKKAEIAKEFPWNGGLGNQILRRGKTRMFKIGEELQ